MATFTFILRSCPDAAKAPVAQLLGKAFSLKESTCASIADSAPIVLLPDLTRDEAAAMHLVLTGFTRLGAVVEFSAEASEELPKIDWPRRPQVFKRDIGDWMTDFQVPLPLPSGGREPLLTLLVGAFTGGRIPSRDTTPVPSVAATAPPGRNGTAGEFRGIQLPEITPFGGVSTLPQSPISRPSTGVSRNGTGGGSDDTLSRLNELFPDEESSGFLPNNQDITSILNKLLPDEDAGAAPLPAAGSGRRAAVGSGSDSLPVQGWAVFLAKIADEGRRQKAVPLIAELAKITPEEAETLSKKVIIPVLKGAAQADAEAAKQKFAKIGILARVKGPE